jgi:hypothetical protein
MRISLVYLPVYSFGSFIGTVFEHEKVRPLKQLLIGEAVTSITL